MTPGKRDIVSLLLQTRRSSCPKISVRTFGLKAVRCRTYRVGVEGHGQRGIGEQVTGVARWRRKGI
ncbi:hypothetical protein E2C01_069462 [Portunus trituberculatus]|uniref:Uncharacterized protein n=1 Tax=Portunus trituberculatus TaxID=210409 RepID=A0A5B7I299_PORTR|nr:hypothetical protein [Portunus trituberculatus]